MASKKNNQETECVQKGNSSDTLLAIYILRVLKKYSSADKKITAKEVYKQLVDEGYIVDGNNPEAQIKKVRRYLHTLHESYGNGCIKKQEGKGGNDGHVWYYDASQDERAGEDGVVHESLSSEEIEFIIDIITSSKILNSAGTVGIIRKLLQKTKLSKEERIRKLRKIKREEWVKSVNNRDLISLRDRITICVREYQKIKFDYEGKQSIIATPYTWDSQDGKYILIAKVDGMKEGEFGSFDLEKIQNFSEMDPDYRLVDDTIEDRRYVKPDERTLENLFDNIRAINAAIKGNVRIEFSYMSYIIEKDNVVYSETRKCVFPHSLVFTDGKYYLIGLDESAEESGKKVDYYRVDLISTITPVKDGKKLSVWDENRYSGIQRARDVEKHPLMLAGQDVPIAFKVIESELSRVVDTFGVKPEKMEVTNETRIVSKRMGSRKNSEPVEERVVKVRVRTTVDEAFWWALANADAVEVETQEVRNMIARVSDPIYQLYTQSMSDKVRENIDHIEKEGWFRIADSVDENTAKATFEELKRCNRTGIVEKIYFSKDDCAPEAYLANFTNTKDLRIYRPLQCDDLSWASSFTKLETFRLNETQVSDVSWLKDMRELTWLEIYDSPVDDLSMLRDHSKIFTLQLHKTNISDISFIENYERLDWLTLIDCPIKDYSPLFRVSSYIKTLEIDKKTAQLIDIEKLRERHIGISIFIY